MNHVLIPNKKKWKVELINQRDQLFSHTKLLSRRRLHSYNPTVSGLYSTRSLLTLARSASEVAKSSEFLPPRLRFGLVWIVLFFTA